MEYRRLTGQAFFMEQVRSAEKPFVRGPPSTYSPADEDLADTCSDVLAIGLIHGAMSST